MAKKKRRWYYVSYYEEYPIYEPAEGGYYYAGNVLQFTHRVGSLKKARKLLKKYIEDAEQYHRPYDYIGKNYAYKDGGDYIGRGRELRIETVPGRRERGYVPYS